MSSLWRRKVSTVRLLTADVRRHRGDFKMIGLFPAGTPEGGIISLIPIGRLIAISIDILRNK